MTLIQRLGGLGFFLLGLSACGSTGASAAGKDLIVTLVDYKTSVRFELANETHTDRVAYYSSARQDAARKVQTDEVMSAFLRELGRLGFEEHARAGGAPAPDASPALRWGIEVASGPNHAHWLVGTGSSGEEWKAFDRCRDTFLQLYNTTVSYQAVENDQGRGYFDDQPRAASGQKPRK